MSTMYKIFVGNISFATTEDQIREVFTPHIVIEDVVIVRDEEGKPKGYAFVMTRDQEKARAAVRRIGKPLIEGRRVYFKEAHGKKKPEKPAQGPRARPPRRGFQQRIARPRPQRGYGGGYSGGPTPPRTPPPTAGGTPPPAPGGTPPPGSPGSQPDTPPT